MLQILELFLTLNAINVVVGLMVYSFMFPGKGHLLANERISSRHLVILPRLYLWVGILDSMAFSIMAGMAISGSGTSSWCANVVLSCFAFLGLYIVLISINFRIHYDETSFRYRTVFRRNHSFGYQDIEKIWRGKYFLHIKTNNRHLYIDIMAIGFHGFIEAINKFGQTPEGKVRQTKNGKRNKKHE